MPYTSFEELDVWKRSCRLAASIYDALRGCRDYGLKDQMTRAAVSVPSNIAEGHERGTTREFIRYLRIAGGSAAELRTQLYIARKIGVLDNDVAAEMIEECKGIGAMLHALAKSRDAGVSDGELEAKLRI